MLLLSQWSSHINNWILCRCVLPWVWYSENVCSFTKADFCEWHNKDFELKQEAVMGRISGLPPVLCCKLVSVEVMKKGAWRSVFCFLSSLLIPHGSGWRESCLHIYNRCGKWRFSSSSPLSSSFHSVLQGLANPLPGHGREIAAFFKAGWTSKLQGYRD